MANIGLSVPYLAKYTYASDTVTYSSGAKLSKAVSVDISNDSATPTKLYADNGPAIVAHQFTGGTLTLGVSSLTLADYALISGQTVSSSDNGLTDPDKYEMPYFGFGIIGKSMNDDNTTKYTAIVLKKIQFNVPNNNYTTQGETVEFATPELTATIMRSDDGSGWRWMGEFTTEALALAAIKSQLA